MIKNNTQIFVKEDFSRLKKITPPNDYYGLVYVMQWGNCVKVGCSHNIYSRLISLNQTARYGGKEVTRIAITPFHYNYCENEKAVHKLLDEYRVKGTELFNISFDFAVEIVNSLTLSDGKYEISRKEREKKECFDAVAYPIQESLNNIQRKTDDYSRLLDDYITLGKLYNDLMECFKGLLSATYTMTKSDAFVLHTIYQVSLVAMNNSESKYMSEILEDFTELSKQQILRYADCRETLTKLYNQYNDQKENVIDYKSLLESENEIFSKWLINLDSIQEMEDK